MRWTFTPDKFQRELFNQVVRQKGHWDPYLRTSRGKFLRIDLNEDDVSKILVLGISIMEYDRKKEAITKVYIPSEKEVEEGILKFNLWKNELPEDIADSNTFKTKCRMNSLTVPKGREHTTDSTYRLIKFFLEPFFYSVNRRGKVFTLRYNYGEEERTVSEGATWKIPEGKGSHPLFGIVRSSPLTPPRTSSKLEIKPSGEEGFTEVKEDVKLEPFSPPPPWSRVFEDSSLSSNFINNSPWGPTTNISTSTNSTAAATFIRTNNR